MHYEYAIEPAAIGSDWETFRYLIEKFGFDKGRLISRFPNKWEKKVISAAKEAGVPDIRMASIIERLKSSKKSRLIDMGRNFNSDAEWMENVLREHAGKPFHAIIALVREKSCAQSISAEEFDDENELYSAPISKDVARTSEALASALFMLTFAAKEIDIVDPFFDLRPLNGDYVGPLSALLAKLAAAGCEGKTFRIHYRTHDSRPPDHIVQQDAPRLTDGLIPDGFTLELNEWEQLPNGEDFHDRFVLSDCGGLLIGAGLSAAGPQEKATLTLLDDQHVQELRQKFSDGATTYSKIGRTVAIKSNGVAELI